MSRRARGLENVLFLSCRNSTAPLLSQLSVKSVTRLVKIDSCINKTPEGMKSWQHEVEQTSGIEGHLFGRWPQSEAVWSQFTAVFTRPEMRSHISPIELSFCVLFNHRNEKSQKRSRYYHLSRFSQTPVILDGEQTEFLLKSLSSQNVLLVWTQVFQNGSQKHLNLCYHLLIIPNI